jgi:hypothetical protein
MKILISTIILCAKLSLSLEAAGIATLKAFDMRKRFFHLEFFMKEGSSITPLEVNIRPPGGLTLNMMNYTFDADCYRTWANLIVNGVSEPLGERSHLVFYVGRKDRIPYQMYAPANIGKVFFRDDAS